VGEAGCWSAASSAAIRMRVWHSSLLDLYGVPGHHVQPAGNVAAFAIAVATRSAKSPMRASVSGGNGSGSDEPMAAIPQTRASTMIGTATVQRRPI
jgi:hypothetical protein